MARIRLGDFGNTIAPLAPRARVPAEAFVQGDNGADILLRTTSSLYAEERKRQEEVATEARRVRGLVIQSSAQTALMGLEEEIATGVLDGSVPKEQAEAQWDKRGQKLIEDATRDAPAEILPAVQAQSKALHDRMRLNVQKAVTKRGQLDIGAGLIQYEELMGRFAVRDIGQATLQYESAIDVVGPKAGLTPEAIQQRKQKFRETTRYNFASQLIIGAQDDPGTLAALKQRFTSEEFFDLDPKLKNALERETDRLIERAQSRREADLKESSARLSSDIEIAVRRGQAGYGDIEMAYKNGVLTPAKRVELTVHLDSENRKAVKTAQDERAALGRVQSAITGRGFLDFRSSDDRKAVDLFYDKVLVPTLERAKVDPAQAMQEVVGFAAKSGIIPSPVRQMIRGALRAGDSQEAEGVIRLFNRVSKVQAADLLDRLKTANPAVLDDFSDEDIALGNTIQTYVRAGVPATQAVALAEKSLSVAEPEREARKLRYTADKAPAKNLKRLERELTGFRWFSPNMPAKVPDALAGEYERFTREEFVRSGELEAAQSTALDHLRRVWGVTQIDGKPRWMKYAPETVYNVPGEDGKWIREQLHADLQKNALWDKEPDLTLAADALTARESQPSYMVLRRKDGVLEPLLGGDGRPLRFRPDYLNSPAGQRRQEALERERAEAAAILAPRGAELPAVTGRARKPRPAP
jgi:hypothetical protein